MSSQPPLPTKLLAISTKMYFTHSQSVTYASALRHHFKDTHPASPSNPTILYIPSTVSLFTSFQTFENQDSRVWLGAQNCHWEDHGAYTGETSPSELVELGVKVVEIGHAERRRYFGESEEVVVKKVKAVVRNGMLPLVCVGEQSRESVQKAVEEVGVQVRSVLKDATRAGERLLFAYEPIWAIGAEKSADGEWVKGVVEGIRGVIKEEGREEDVKVVYGGSAGPGTWTELKGAVDGLFLGRFAHKVGNVTKVWEEMVGEEKGHELSK